MPEQLVNFGRVGVLPRQLQEVVSPRGGARLWHLHNDCHWLG